MEDSGGERVWPRRSVFYEIFRYIMMTWFGLSGWKAVGVLPKGRKFVVIGAPHTSNWDFPYMLAIALYWRIPVKWLGKDALFKPAVVGVIMRKLGGIAIDRSKKNNVVGQLAARFSQTDELVLVVPPEGTRGQTKYWKSGFYHIAHQAKVPLLLCFLDYDKKAGGAEREFMPTGDYEADMVEIKAFYNTVKGKFPDQGRAE